MVNAIYKGDIAEVSWGKETGLVGIGDAAATGWTHTSVSGNTSLITLGTGNYWVDTALEVPDNSLVGGLLLVTGGTEFALDDHATTRRSYYIIANDTTNKTITVQPALVTTTSTVAGAADTFTICSPRIPTFDAAMTDGSQRVKTDQFFGLLNSFSLPEPEIEVKQQHIVGMGRDVNVLTSGKESLAGGSLNLNAHSLRWLKYALGGVTSRSTTGELSHSDVADSILTARPLHLKDAAALAGCTAQVIGASGVDTVTEIAGTVITGLTATTTGKDILIGLTSSTNGTATSITLGANYDTIHDQASTVGGIFKHVSTAGAILYGSYTAAATTELSGCLDIDAGALAAARTNGTLGILPKIVTSISAGDLRVDVGSTTAGKFAVGEYIQIIDKDTQTIPGADSSLPTVFKNEVRRVIAVLGDYIYIEEEFSFSHAANSCGVERMTYRADGKRGSPHIDATTKELQNGVTHTIFGGSRLPTFMIEQSFRSTDASPGANQLLRLYNGCKVNTATVNADSEGELGLNIDYEATRHYTDVPNVMQPHRMFEDTANTAVNRKASGIAVDGEKPYLFQDISIEVFGAPVLRGNKFEFQISNNNAARYYIRGFEGASSDNDQVQLGSTQTAMEITEAQRGYTFRFSAIVEDDRLWEEVRTRRHHTNADDIVLRLKKRGSAATRESATITLEDYTIVKADHQLPDDKGAVIVEVDLIVRHLKIEENSPYLTL